ncbi:MAG: protein-disulfide reductase DsbD N-terminal domain-containing protein, partial [Rikenellaceae bacterium]|nr:protein-disulfide reductase DsbD N-terminal domain-containing protein [Rikenellaceae bacterium]
MRLLRAVFTAFVTIILSVAGAGAQGKVEWKTSVEHLGGGKAKVVFTADIADGWHMYDTRRYEMGPNSTEFVFTVLEGLKLDGGIREVSKAVRKYDEIFEMEIGFFEKRAEFEQAVTLTADKAIIGGEVSWMVCDDSTCLPPDEYEFSIDIARPTEAVA